MKSIYISEPCNANWRKMPTVENGRFCNTCEKTVHDFTTWEPQDIIAYLQQQTQPVCGRVKQEVVYTPVKPYKNQFMKYVAGVILFIIASCKGKLIDIPPKGTIGIYNGDSVYTCNHKDVKTLDFQHKPNINDSNRLK